MLISGQYVAVYIILRQPWETHLVNTSILFQGWINYISVKSKCSYLQRQSDPHCHSVPPSGRAHDGNKQLEKKRSKMSSISHTKSRLKRENLEWNIGTAAVGRPWSALCLETYRRESRAGFPIQRAQATTAWQKRLMRTEFQSRNLHEKSNASWKFMWSFLKRKPIIDNSL